VTLPAVLDEFLVAVEKRDAHALGACFADDATYATAVPLPAMTGREAIGKMFRGLLSQVSAAHFEILTYSVDGDPVRDYVDMNTWRERKGS
jgi:limonene-1,2-epoxide hydrolase